MVKTHYKKADSIVFLSEGAAGDFAKRFSSIDTTKFRVVHNPVDINRISKLKGEPIDAQWWPSSKRTIISAGRLNTVKGYNYLLEAMQIVSRALPDTRLVVMGSGEEEENLRAYSKQLGIDESVAFVGFQENPFKYIANSDVFVLSSLWEGFANVVVEAMACGVPVVATNCPYGPREIVQHEVNGILVPPRDSQALALSIIRVLTNSKLASTLVDNAVERAKDFHVATIVKEYEMLFRRLVE
jgi:glycosyltransferase involved in cell wall biosynthesis